MVTTGGWPAAAAAGGAGVAASGGGGTAAATGEVPTARGGTTRLVAVYAGEARTATTVLAVARGGSIGGGSGSRGVCHYGAAASTANGTFVSGMRRLPAGGAGVVVPTRRQKFRWWWSIGASTVDRLAVDGG